MTADFHDLLVKTSRTFALSIPLLEPPTDRQVTLAYLLFRIADTFEDAAVWPKQRRISELERFADLVAQSDQAAYGREIVAEWLREPPTSHQGYLELLEEAPAVLAELDCLDEAPGTAIRRHTVRTARGMAAFTRRANEAGVLRLETLVDLRDYCYVVAGIVGEMLTELFLADGRCHADAAELLRRRAASFGEALQLVNILRDSADDRVEGRTFLPAGTERERVFALAREDLGIAEEYTTILRQYCAPAGTIAFTTLPVRLAWATLEAVERQGPGAKVPREQVLQMFQDVRAGSAS